MGGYALAEYNWNAALLRQVFVVPADVADSHLRLAGAVQLKVLLWLSRHDGQFDEQACSQAVGASPADCRDALRYWVDAGVLAAAPDTVVVERVTPPTEAKVKPTQVRRPAAVKPQLPQVMERRAQNAEFASLLDEVSARLGRPLSPGDMETLLYLFDTAALPAAVILMVVGYAATAAERLSMRYIEKVALDWADRGIVTMTAAEEYLCELERMGEAADRVRVICGLEKRLNTTAQQAAAERWLYRWSMEDGAVRLAYEMCLKKLSKFHVPYINRVLESWHEQGITTEEQAIAACGGKPVTAPTGAVSEYEDMVAGFIPVYQKKKKKG